MMTTNGLRNAADGSNHSASATVVVNEPKFDGESHLTAKITFSSASKEYQKGNFTQALTILNQLVDVQKDGKTYALLAKVFLKLGFKSDAASSYQLAANQEDVNSMEYQRQAMKLYFECGNEDEALLMGKRLYDKAPADAEVAFVLASIFLKRGQRNILDSLRKPLLNSSNSEHLALAARLMTDASSDQDNRLTLQMLLQKVPNDNAIRALYLVTAREINDYAAIAKHQPIIESTIASGDLRPLQAESSFFNLFWCGNEEINRATARSGQPLSAETSARRRAMPHKWSDKIRIGYLSADLWDQHATMKLLRNVLERHDRDRFEVVLFCYTPAEFLRQNVADRSAWGRIVPIDDLSSEQAANAIRENGIDILIDLKGHTKGGRVDILNLPAAPIHVAWLGFPGSTVNIDLDYIIGDRHVLPETSQPHYHEKFCRLPETYQPNDPVNRPPLQPLSRSELGLPEDSFIFASFNNNRKISLDVIELWARILKRAENSILVLLTTNEKAQINIQKAFQSRGISPKRVIFTPKVDYIQHLNRQQAADIGLDTFPVNGHTTTSEQLWGGLPVISLKGTNFASRVSESLLNAIGLPELVADDKDAYVELAVSCYENRERVAALKAKLEESRFVMPLFDSERFCRHLETAYEMMVARARDGLEPDHFDVPALPPRTAPFQ